MLSEGSLRAERISQEITKYSKAKGIPVQEMEDVAYILLAALMLRDESRIKQHLPASHAIELTNLITNVLEEGDPSKTEKQFEEIKHLLSMSMGAKQPRQFSRERAGIALGIRHMAGMLLHEVGDLEKSGRGQVFDVLFYKLFSRLVPSQQRHHMLVARFAYPMVDSLGEILEFQPGPGEVSVLSRRPDRKDKQFEDAQANLPEALSERLRFIRNLRLAVHDVAFESSRNYSLTSTLSLVDTSLKFARDAYGDASMIFLRESTFDGLSRFLMGHTSRTLVVLKGKDRISSSLSGLERRADLVEYHNLRAVIDFSSFASKRMAPMGMLYFGPSFPAYEDMIVQIDARRLQPNVKTEEIFSCAMLIGTMLRNWSEGHDISIDQLKEFALPQRIIAFIESAFSTHNTYVPGFLRFVSRFEMAELNFSLRAEDYVGKNDEQAWQPEVEIDPILSCLRKDRQSTAVFLIGNNGAGKSLAMRDVAMALSLEGSRSFGISFGLTDRFDRSAQFDPLKSQFTYAGARSSSSGPNTRRILGELGDMAKDIYRDFDRLACFEIVLSILGFGQRQFLVPVNAKSVSDQWERLLADIHPLSARADTERERDDMEKWQALPGGAYKLAFVRDETSEIVVFDSLSSGEQQILTLILKIVAKVQRGVVVLLDEPELSLHVGWQLLLPQVLRKLSEYIGCSFVVATHSPVVIASANDENDYCFVIRDRRLSELGRIQRRSVEATLFEGFKTYTPLTHHVQERCAEIVAQLIEDTSEDGAIAIGNQSALKDLEDLKASLSKAERGGAKRDAVLVDAAIAAVREILEL